ncbi:MAG: asparagine--tRNA ligase [Clostridia bacterium]|jgi:asparaginyl-tRNA synthetase|nr:asparagine--tRNA ligase [Clostridia bacterium]
MKHTDIYEVLRDKTLLGKSVTVCGWVRTFRDSAQVAFLELADGTSFARLQVVIDKNTLSPDAECLKNGAAVCVRGEVVKAFKGEGCELNAAQVTLLGACPPEYPIQKKRTTLEFLRSVPHLRLRTNTFTAAFRVRSVAAQAIHRYFHERRYYYINTPLITASDCEGAGEMFRVTTQPFDAKYSSETEYYKNDFFGKKAGLSVSGQLEGEVAATAFSKIYTFGPSFRAENSNTTKHLAEFWHIEPEVAFAELSDVMEIAEEMIKYVISAVLTECADEIAFFDQFMEKGLKEKLLLVVNSDFAVCEYTQAVELLKKSGVAFQYPVSWGCDLQTEHERYLTETVFRKPVFVTNYPKEIKSFYMKQNPDGKTVAATDLLVPGIGEIIGGSQREEDHEKLLSAMNARGMDVSAYGQYLDLRIFGSVPHGGFGLGFERLVMYMTGIENIRDVTLFPRSVGSIM